MLLRLQAANEKKECAKASLEEDGIFNMMRSFGMTMGITWPHAFPVGLDGDVLSLVGVEDVHAGEEGVIFQQHGIILVGQHLQGLAESTLTSIGSNQIILSTRKGPVSRISGGDDHISKLRCSFLLWIHFVDIDLEFLELIQQFHVSIGWQVLKYHFKVLLSKELVSFLTCNAACMASPRRSILEPSFSLKVASSNGNMAGLGKPPDKGIMSGEAVDKILSSSRMMEGCLLLAILEMNLE